MKYRTPVLLGVTLALAAMTFVLARAVHQGREHDAEQAAARASAGTSAQASAGNPVAAGNSMPGRARDVDATPIAWQGEVAGDVNPRPVELNALSNDRLRLLRNPESRLKLLAETEGRMSNQYRGLDAFLGISADELQQLVRRLAERDLTRQERMLECRATPGCKPRSAQQDFDATFPMADLFAPGQVERFGLYTDSNTERRPIERWAGRLPPGVAPTAADAERLVMALHEVRQQFEAEAQRRGEATDVYSNGIPLRAAASPATTDRSARLIASASDYAGRLSKQAATVLSGQQLAAFNADVETTLARYKVFVEEREVRETARREAGLEP